jgi:hypothetical protein
VIPLNLERDLGEPIPGLILDKPRIPPEDRATLI